MTPTGVLPQNVSAYFFRRVEGRAFPWTDDQVLRRFKFTNAYRASDRVSQYLIRHVVYRGDDAPREVFFRTLLFKIFNRIDTWKLLEAKLGEITLEGYGFERYDSILTQALERGVRIFSAAYIMPSGGHIGAYRRKHQYYLRVLEQMMADELPGRLAECPEMRVAFEWLKGYPLVGPFLAYQYTMDINYSSLTDFSEMDFVVPGPGARDGIHKCFSDLGDFSEADVIRYVTERQQQEFEERGLIFQDLWGRPLQLIDCQNLFLRDQQVRSGRAPRGAWRERSHPHQAEFYAQRYRARPALVPAQVAAQSPYRARF